MSKAPKKPVVEIAITSGDVKIINDYINLGIEIDNLQTDRDALKELILAKVPGHEPGAVTFKMGQLNLGERAQTALDEEAFLALPAKERQFLIEAGAVTFTLGKNKDLAKEKGLVETSWTRPAITVAK